MRRFRCRQSATNRYQFIYRLGIDCHELSIPSIGYHEIIVVLVWVFLEKEGGEEAGGGGGWVAWLWPVLSEPPRLWNPSFSFWEASFLLSHSSFANTFGSESRLAVAWLPGLPSLSKRVRLDRAPNKSVMFT